jgi:hypothetical protein
MTASASTVSSPAPPTPDPIGRSPVDAPRYHWPRRWSWSLTAALYLALAFALWWHAWSASPSGVMTCDCTDAGRMVWYLEWVPFALGHGHSLLFSTFQFHPKGFNLLADTSALALGTLFSPVTVLFGPVVSMNLISTLIPAATAFSMFWLLLRWVRWVPAAFVGGLAYGFSAWVLVQLAFGWINLACVALLPLVAVCLDELVIRQRRRAVVVGAVLALLVVVEFFVSIEMALLAVLTAVVAILLLVGAAAVAERDALRLRFRHAATGLLSAVAVAAVLLAYPVWFFTSGPAHLSGSVWTTNVPGALGNTIGNLWDPVGHYGSISSTFLGAEARALGGFAGTAGPSPSYLGWGLLAVLAIGLVLWRSDRRLWLLGGLGAITLVLSLQVGPHRWGVWSLFYHLPILLNVVQYRFAGVFVLCAAAMLGVILDRCHASVLGLFAARRSSAPATGSARGSAPRHGRRRAGGGPSAVVAAGVAAAVAAVALVPEVHVLAPNLPVPMRPVTVPRWFSTAALRLPAGTVLVTYPFATADSQSSIPWQAISGLPYQMAGGGGPAGTVPRAGGDKAGFAVLRQASVTTLAPPALDRANLSAVRKALRDWRVTMVVVPGDTGLLSFQTGRGTAYGVAFFTAVLGSVPVRQDGAWVWTDVGRDTEAPAPISPAALSACLAAFGSVVPGTDAWAACVLRSASHG